jgi:hypothetical protein
MIKLLEKYHAYAPPFRWEPPTGGPAYIGGVDGRVPYDEDLCNQLKEAWRKAHAELVTKSWPIPSKTRVGVMYTVRKILDGYTCTCPARGECWHIKVARHMDMEEDCDKLDFIKRTNDYS